MKKIENVQDIFPLSPMQQGMFFHTLYSKSSAYHIQTWYTFQGDLDISALQRAWQRILDRHAILRSIFTGKNKSGQPLQVVRQHATLPWEYQNWVGLSSIQQQERLEALLLADRERGFELTHAPLMRLALIQTDEKEFELIWSYHHLLLDGWSTSLIFKEMFIFYEAFSLGQDVDLELPKPYRDYIAWLKKQDMAEAEAYWRQMLGGFTTTTPLPNRSPMSIVDQKISYTQELMRLSKETTNALQTLARQNNLTVSTLVQGAWALLLGRYSGEKDVVFGTVVSGRPAELPGSEAMVGLFINTLPVRARISPDMPVILWLKEFQNQLVEMRKYEYSPLVQVKNWSEMPRTQSLFDNIVAFENYPVDTSLLAQEDNLKIKDVQSIEPNHYPLTALAAPGEMLHLSIRYDSQLFDAATIERMARHWQVLLEGIVAHPEQSVFELPLLTEAERQQAIEVWNATAAEYPRDKCVHELVETQVERVPEAVAVVCGEDHVTYQELDRRANQLGQHLRRLEVGPEVVVGIWMGRSIEQVVGLLGILKAGGAYLPLEPDYPAERLGYMIEEAGVPVVLTVGELVERVATREAVVICLDTGWGVISQEKESKPAVKVDSENLAYVIYTSGSTGQPKGVMLTHRGIVNYLSWCERSYPLGEGCGAPVHSSLGFDLTVTGLWGTLATGGRVRLVSEGRGIGALSAALREEGDYGLVKLTPAHIELLSQELKGEEAGGRTRALIIGGEQLVWERLGYWQAHAKGTELVNEYGPTETAVGCCVYWASEGGREEGAVPIGRPIINTVLYILDERQRVVPIGVAGELYIGGAGVARGYVERADLTAERFVPNPYDGGGGGRLYRTGDMARYRPDGNLEYLGRRDGQVKLRGYRVELGEIEAVLRQAERVREAVVVVREEEVGDQRLVAYVVGEAEPAPEVEELRRYVQGKLPEYMAPAAYVVLEALPLTPNGKVDRRALPAPEGTRSGVESAYQAPQTPTEELVAKIWAEVLKVDKVGTHDDFFELGGHSLLATQAIFRVREAFQIELPLRSIFDMPTVAELAQVVDTALCKEPTVVDKKPITFEEGRL